MSELLRPFLSLPDRVPDRPYAPFLPAVERGDVQLDELNIRRLEAPLGQMLINGRIPQQNDAGVVEVGPGELIIVDHVRLLHADTQQVMIGPSSKASVDKDSGSIRDEGLLAITHQDGRVRYVAGVLDTTSNPWQANQLGVPWATGRLAVVQFGLDALDYEAVDIDTETGIVKTAPRKRY